MKTVVVAAGRAVLSYLLSNKKARALEYALLLGVAEAVRAAIFGA